MQHKILRKTLLTILILALLLGIVPVKAFAATKSKAVELKVSAKSCKAGGSITISSDSGFSRIYIEWEGIPGAWTLKAGDTELACGQNGFQHEYVELPEDVKKAKLVMPDGGKISTIRAYPADGLPLPSSVEVWEPQPERADVLVFATHPDDEALFLGGAIATLAAQKGFSVIVVHLMGYRNVTPEREHERLHGIWTMGVKQYPIAGRYDAVYTKGYKEYSGKIVNTDAVAEYLTGLIRRFKPQIVITQDLNGEYGHVRHKVLAAAVVKAVKNSMDPAYASKSYNKYGVWDVPKTYLHLYTKNKIVLDLRQPIEALGGKTAFDAAVAAFKKHVSQQKFKLYVTDDPNDKKSRTYNASYFGLYRTTVGKDTGNDMTENIISYVEQERLAAEEVERLRIKGISDSSAELAVWTAARTEEICEALRAERIKAEEAKAELDKTLAAASSKRNNTVAILCAAAAVIWIGKGVKSARKRRY